MSYRKVKARNLAVGDRIRPVQASGARFIDSIITPAPRGTVLVKVSGIAWPLAIPENEGVHVFTRGWLG